MTGTMTDKEMLFEYVLRLADDHLVLAHRLSEWCGHAPMLEEDLALPNISLDLLGQARSLYSYAGEIEGKGRGEDELAYVRPEHEYHNLLMLELDNGDFARTMLRLYLFAAFMADPSAMGEKHRHAEIEELAVDKRARNVRDYLAGMTDTYAIAAHRRLFDDTPELR